MGIYDVFGERGVQLKCGICEMKEYKIGDKVDLFDGIYVSLEGIVVIYKGKFVAELNEMFDKYGNHIGIDVLLKERNPISKVVKEWSNDHHKQK